MIKRGAIQGRRPPLLYRSSSLGSGATGVNKPAGVAIGDLVVVVASAGDNTLQTVAGGTWTKNQIGDSALYWKVLNSTDVANGWSYGVSEAAYNNAVAYSPNGMAIRSVTVRRTGSTFGTSLTLAGYIGGRPRGMISACIDNAENVIPTTPSGFVSRATGESYGRRIADNLNNYPGFDVTWTALGSGSGLASAWLLEVL